MSIEIKNGRVIDPANGVDEVISIFIESCEVVGVGESPEGFVVETIIDATDQWVIPGIVDLQARLREPGHENKGTIASETRAAAHGGITTLCMPPDTHPIIDTPAVAEQIEQLSIEADFARVLPIAALTQGLGGEYLAEIDTLVEAGCIAASNANEPIKNTQVLRKAMEYAASRNIRIILRPEDPWLAAGGFVNEGPISAKLGLSGIPNCAEVIAVSQALFLIEQTGVSVHFGQLSSAKAVDLIADAKQKGLDVTASVSIHHLFLNEIDVGDFNPLCHVRPPLRSQRDMDSLRAGVADGAIDTICSDHQPHNPDAKLAPFESTEPGISSVETMLPLLIRLVDEDQLTTSQAIAAVTCNPANALQLPYGQLGVGSLADIAIIDPDKYWTVDRESLLSQGKNTPFLGWQLKGEVTHTLFEGQIVYKNI
jgi:dihydroorotase